MKNSIEFLETQLDYYSKILGKVKIANLIHEVKLLDVSSLKFDFL